MDNAGHVSMADNLAGWVNPRCFKASKKDPEKMLADFKMYIKLFKNFLMIRSQLDKSRNQSKICLIHSHSTVLSLKTE